MRHDTERQEAARKAGEEYGNMAADLCLIHLSNTWDEELIHEHIMELARNIREQALQHEEADLGQELAPVWKDAALKAAQARLAAGEGTKEPR